jgi:hypothetical protein
MRLKHQLRLLVTILAVGSLAMPVTTLAGKHCGMKKSSSNCSSCCGRGGIMYNQYDGKYYNVPGCKGSYVYRAVDLSYVKVAKYGTHCSCKTGKCHKHMVSVSCQDRPGYWWGSTWMAPSQECWYHK